MPIEIPCPGCRFRFRADDEFAGESAPCPHCGATIAVPRSVGVLSTIGHLKRAPDRRVRQHPSASNSFPLCERPPIPQHAEPRPIVLPEPDEDDPLNEGGYWPFGPMVPPGRRMRALHEFHCSTTRVASLLVEPLKRLKPLYVVFHYTVGCLIVLWGVAYKLWDDYPYPALVLALAGCIALYAVARQLRQGADEDTSEAPSYQSESSTKRRRDELD